MTTLGKLARGVGFALALAFALSAPRAAGAQDGHEAHGAPSAQDSAHAAAPAPTVGHGADSLAAAVGSHEVQHGTATPEHEVCGHHGEDIILPHITDSRCLEVPTFPKVWQTRSIALPQWAPIQIGGFALDISPTKHVVMLFIAAILCCLVLITAAVAHKRHSHAKGHPRGFAAGIEAMVLYIRNEVAIPNLGHHGEGYAPFILTLFWFILFANLLGLIPFGSTATGNISVTATLAVFTFLVIEFAGMRAQGMHYLGTIFYWNKELPIVMRVLMFVIMTPVEIIGKISKPFALAIRLFANMTAGHIVVLALLGLIFTFKSLASGAPFLMAVAIMMLELFVAFLQAFIFSLLASVFIGQIRTAH